MSLDYSLARCAEDVNTNEKFDVLFGSEASYSLAMACMACGVPELKTAADCERLYDRVRALGWVDGEKARKSWWTMITKMQGYSTNATKTTDAQFAKQLIDKMKRDGERERRQMTKEG